MVVNPSKFQAILFGLKKNQNLALEVNVDAIANSREVNLLGVSIDSQLNFRGHVKALCVKADRKVSAFVRVAIDIQKVQSLY